MRAHLHAAGHRCPAHLVLEPAGGLQLPFQIPPRGGVLPQSAICENSRIIGQLRIRALDGPDAHTLADQISQDELVLESAGQHLLTRTWSRIAFSSFIFCIANCAWSRIPSRKRW